MKSDTNSTKTEALQNSLVQRCAVDRGWCWSSVEWVCCTRTDTNLTEKGSPARAQGNRAWSKQVREPVSTLSCLCWGAEEENTTRQLLCSQRGISMNAACQTRAPRRVNDLPIHDLGFLQTAAPMGSSPQVVCLTSLQEQCNALQALSQPSPLIFKLSRFKTHWLQELTKFNPSHFPSQWRWGNVLPVHSPV